MHKQTEIGRRAVGKQSLIVLCCSYGLTVAFHCFCTSNMVNDRVAFVLAWFLCGCLVTPVHKPTFIPFQAESCVAE